MSDSLAAFIDTLTHEEALRVESDLGHGFVRLRVSEAQRRQAAQDIRCVEDVVIEMLRNARDAGARALFLAAAKVGSLRKIVVVDNGSGIPDHLLETVFEPRVTSKAIRCATTNGACTGAAWRCIPSSKMPYTLVWQHRSRARGARLPSGST